MMRATVIGAGIAAAFSLAAGDSCAWALLLVIPVTSRWLGMLRSARLRRIGKLAGRVAGRLAS